MATLIAASAKDKAALNIASKLIEGYSFEESEGEHDGRPVLRRDDVLLAYVSSDGIYAEGLDRSFKVDRIIFASRHRSESGKPTLTVHVTGNPTSQALFGGEPRTLSLAEPSRMKVALRRLHQLVAEVRLGYDVCLEATHHGPTGISVPVMFVEIGSSEKEWADDRAAEVVAEAIWAAATTASDSKCAFGLGGGHYCPKHTRIMLEEDIAVGHILPKYFFEDFDGRVVEQAYRKTLPKCKSCVVDWKGIPGEGRKEALRVLEGLGVEVVRV